MLTAGLIMTSMVACGAKTTTSTEQNKIENTVVESTVEATEPTDEGENFEGTTIELSDAGIQVDGESASTDSSAAVYVGADIVYYEDGKDDTYGAGSEEEAHSAEEAAKHTVVTITQPGEYKVSGTLSYGQIAVNLGEDAKEDESAVVTLILDNADITCTVAPGIIVYKAYECGSDDTETATATVDTKNAGFHLVLADNSTNVVNGSHVAKIYKEGTTDKLHKYDGAIESKVSFNINGETLGNGKLTVNADNEGISSSLHLTINGGDITINSGDDAINTNEDGVSVFTMNGGVLTCDSDGGDEGDGIDSNGFLVINGGYIITSANSKSMDSGLDSDLGIYINGGTVLATGNMYDEISGDSTQNLIVMNFNNTQKESDYILIKDSEGNPVVAFHAVNDYSMLIYSSPDLVEGDYTVYNVTSVKGDLNGSIYTNITSYDGEQQLQYTSGSVGMGGFKGNRGEMGGTGERPAMPADGEMPAMPAEGEMPEMPANGERPEMPADGEMPAMPENGMENPMQQETSGEPSTTFTIVQGMNTFGGISAVTAE